MSGGPPPESPSRESWSDRWRQLSEALEREDLEAARRHLKELAAAEEALRRERRLLSQRVAARTADLSAANAKLTRVARTKSEFLASVGHELRTPLNGILSISETLQEELYGPVTQRQKRSLKMIEESGRHLLSLINDLLDLSRVEAGKLQLQLRPVDARRVSRASLAMTQQMAQRKGLSVVARAEENLPEVYADERRLKQILVNLLSNAVKFTPAAGQVGLEVTAPEGGERVVFEVWDTGLGIDPQRAAEVFQPFAQIDAGFDRTFGGTGLGLAMVARLTEMQGGCVSLESAGHQKGASFQVSLPAARVRRTPPDATPAWVDGSDDLGRTRPRVLLAEDNEATITALGLALTQAGFQVTIARHGGEALDRVREERPALVVMDLQMPVLSGLESCRRLRQVAEFRDLPVIGLTSLAVPGDGARCRAVEIHRVLSKPVAARRLVAAVREELGRGSGGEAHSTNSSRKA